MPKLTVIFDDKSVHVDGVGLTLGETDPAARFDAKVTELDMGDVWAIQWDGTEGTIEMKDKSQRAAVEADDVTPWVDFYAAEYELFKQDMVAAADADFVMREARNQMLKDTDMWALSDTPDMTDAQIAYRQALRDLPSTDAWNPTASWDDEQNTVTYSGVTFPSRP